MSRQFGLKRSTSAERLAMADLVRKAAQAAPELKHEQAPPIAPQPEPLYAPASWRGNTDRRSVSAS